MGFRLQGRARGSHQVYVRVRDEVTYIAVIPLAKREIARGTLKAMLETGGVSEQEFLDAL